ncbi:MAG: BtpA/SgcQ family protein [Planctomycetota bacterium]|nr:BtpA/SgcQ family protein [Planctomycetota bacterium]
MTTAPQSFHQALKHSQSIVAMIHIGALPGTPRSQFSPQQILDKALSEAEIYKRAGVDVLAIENMHDRPYLKESVGPEITALMTFLGREIKRHSQLPCGVQILAGANKEALAVALAADLDFVRAEGFVFAHVADEGLIQAQAADLLRYRKMIGADSIPIFTDIKKKHSAHAITADVSLIETAHAAEFFLSDGLIITGAATGKAASINDVRSVREHSELPVIVGSGVDIENVEAFLSEADALIVGSHFKEDGHWAKPVDASRVNRFMDKVRQFRK